MPRPRTDTIKFLTGDETFVAGQGDFVFVPRGIRHRFKNVSNEQAKMIFLYTPAGPEALFLQGGDEPVPGERPTPWPFERVAALAELSVQTGTIILPEDLPPVAP